MVAHFLYYYYLKLCYIELRTESSIKCNYLSLISNLKYIYIMYYSEETIDQLPKFVCRWHTIFSIIF